MNNAAFADTIGARCASIAERAPRHGRQVWRLTASAIALALLAGCAHQPADPAQAGIALTLRTGWYEGKQLTYITTDVSDADVAREKQANFAPRLAAALAPPGSQVPGRSSVDKVYAVTNFAQDSIFASAPDPVGPQSRDQAYSPLWQMVKVTWSDPGQARVMKSEEEVLAAAERRQVQLEATRVVLNCPIVRR
jgi:hypothetical protein